MPAATQPQITLAQARENLFKKATQPTAEELPEIFNRIKKLLDGLSGELLWPMVKSAHQAVGVQLEVFVRALYLPYTNTGKQGDPQYTVLTKNERWDASADPYTQLDLKAWCNYLVYGGGIKYDLSGSRINTNHHRAFFDFFHLPYHPNELYKGFCGWLKKILEARNTIEHETYPADPLQWLSNFLYTTVDVLAHMRHVSWNEQRDLWMDRLCREFFEAIGETDYEITGICDYLAAMGHTADPSNLEQLMTEAGMAVDGGKVAYSGDILLLITEDLPETLELARKDRHQGTARLKKAVRGTLPPYAQLTYEQKKRAIALLEKYSPKLKKYLVEAIREAHQAAGIQPVDFHSLYTDRNQIRKDKEGNIGRASLADGDYRNHPESDYYKRLDLQGWLKYLRYGGSRQDGNGKPLQDQDLVFTYLGISYAYTADAPRELKCEIGEHLAHLMDVRNDITGHWTAATVKKTTTREIMQWYEALLALLEPMSQANWRGKQECEGLAEDLKRDFRTALGGLSYAVSDILAYLKAPGSILPEVEQRLVELGYPVAEGCVTVGEDIEAFLTSLPTVIRMTRDFHRLPESAAEAKKLRTWVMSRGRASDQRAVAWFEKAAQATPPMPAAMYYLGCCGMFVRGMDADKHEVMAWIHLAAKKGYIPAQVRMGQYREGWYSYLESPLTHGGICRDNEGLRADMPEIAPAWRQKAGEQRSKITDLTAALIWYQKAADREDPDGLYHLGRCCKDGIGMDVDSGQAYQCFWEAARQSHRPARYALAQCYDGEVPGIMIHRKKAWQIYETLAEEKYIPAMKTLAYRYATMPTGRDLIRAVKLMEQAGNLGDASAYTELAHWFLDGKLVKPHEEEGIRWLKRAAKAEDPEGLRLLGECCQFGIGVERNSAAAEHLLRKAAAAGDLLAQWDLGNREAEREDLSGARRFYEKAQPHSPMLKSLCEASQYKMVAEIPDYPRAGESRKAIADLLLPLAQKEDLTDDRECFVRDLENMGKNRTAGYLREYYTDSGADNWAERIAWRKDPLLERLDEARLQWTQAIIRYELAECFEKQAEVPEAFCWYTQAAEQGLPKAMLALGRCYEQGVGVVPDREKAWLWYEKAADTADGKTLCCLADRHLQIAGSQPENAETRAAREKAAALYSRAYCLGYGGLWNKLFEMGITPDEDMQRQWAQASSLGVFRLPQIIDNL